MFLIGTYNPTPGTTGTATVAYLAPFQVNSSTGAITIADTTGLEVDQDWEVVVRVTDDNTDTDDGTFTVELVDTLSEMGCSFSIETGSGISIDTFIFMGFDKCRDYHPEPRSCR